MIKIALVLLLAFSVVAEDELYNKIIHYTDPDALCLDGTPPLLYVHEGTDKNRFLIFFMGGGLCSGMTLDQTIADCYARSKTNLGSSNGWPDTLKGEGYLSTNPAVSDFASWTKIVFGYCDGSLHQGNRRTPILYRGERLYFRGGVITRAHFKWIIQRYPNFRYAAQVIVTGSSAGGIASYLWANYVRTLALSSNSVVAIPDSSIFIITKTFKTNQDYLQTIIQNMFKLANTDEKTPLDLCNGKYVNEEYKCLFIQNAWTSFQVRTMLVNSEYDSWVIQNALKISCLKNGTTEYTLSGCSSEELNFIEDYRRKYKAFMEFYMMNTRSSCWSIGCSQHGYSYTKEYFNSDTERVPARSGMTIKEAIHQFVFDQQRVHEEEDRPWPYNSGCAM